MTNAAKQHEQHSQAPARERPFFSPGWYRDLSNEEYHGSFGYGSTTLKKLHEMPLAKLEYQQRNPSPPSEAMNLGTAVHTLVLEPEKAEEEIAVLPNIDRRTNAGKAAYADFMAENDGKIILTEAKYEQAQAMAESVLEHPQIGQWFEKKMGGMAEQSIYYWYNPEDWDDQNDYRIMCKVRPDWVLPGHPVIFDLKTTTDASFSKFGKKIKDLDYHMSAAMYLDGCNRDADFKKACGVMAFTTFIWVVVESEKPHLSTSYKLTPDKREAGQIRYHQACRKLHDYKRSSWKGYGDPDPITGEILPVTRDIDFNANFNNIV